MKEITGKMLMTEISIEELDPTKITNEIYDSVLREVIDEVNVPRKCLTDPLLMGIGRNTTSAGRPSAEFLVRYTYHIISLKYNSGVSEPKSIVKLETPQYNGSCFMVVKTCLCNVMVIKFS